MLKQEFITRLSRCLASLPEEERQNTLEFYIEQIDDRIDDGMREDQAVASLEAPEDIAANILAEREEVYVSPFVEKTATVMKKRGNRIALIVILILTAWLWIPLGLGIVGTLVGVYVALWCALIGFAVGGIGLAVGFCALVGMGFSILPTSIGAAVSHFGAGLVCLGLGIICGIIAIYGAKWLIKATVSIFKGIGSLFAKKRRSELVQTADGTIGQVVVAPDGTRHLIVEERTSWSVGKIVLTCIAVVLLLFVVAFFVGASPRGIKRLIVSVVMLAALGAALVFILNKVFGHKATFKDASAELYQKSVSGVSTAANKVESMIHNAASNVASATKPKDEEDRPMPPDTQSTQENEDDHTGKEA